MSGPENGWKSRALQRRRRIVVHRAHSQAEAEQWDLEFWQSQTPQMRLSALVSLREDLKKVKLLQKQRRRNRKNKGPPVA